MLAGMEQGLLDAAAKGPSMARVSAAALMNWGRAPTTVSIRKGPGIDQFNWPLSAKLK